jgi:hypothetical protein
MNDDDVEKLSAFIEWLRAHEMEICKMPQYDYYGRHPTIVTDIKQLVTRYLEENVKCRTP